MNLHLPRRFMSDHSSHRRRLRRNGCLNDYRMSLTTGTTSSELRQIVVRSSKKMGTDDNGNPSWIFTSAALYVLSGVSQPILMAYAKRAGLADPGCQLYMLFYYLGPATVALTMRCPGKRSSGSIDRTKKYGSISSDDVVCDDCHMDVSTLSGQDGIWPSSYQMKYTSAIAIWDIFAQSMVYAGNNLSGPTIFSIIYSSVTIWTAIYSKFLLARHLSGDQWMGVVLVVIGLSITALDSLSHGAHVFTGACLIFLGSLLHAMTYVLSEMVMTSSSIPSTRADLSSAAPLEKPTSHLATYTGRFTQQRPEPISVKANCAIQGVVAFLIFLLWQIIYTLPRFQSLIIDAMNDAGTTPKQAFGLLLSIAFANLLHSVTFYQTLKDFPGGATSAGVLKGLQAVLVFTFSSILLCGRVGGSEMCWTRSKLFSLIVVICGIMFYGKSTAKADNGNGYLSLKLGNPTGEQVKDKQCGEIVLNNL